MVASPSERPTSHHNKSLVRLRSIQKVQDFRWKIPICDKGLADSAVRSNSIASSSQKTSNFFTAPIPYHQLSESRQFAGHLQVLRLTLCSLFANGTFSNPRRTVR